MALTQLMDPAETFVPSLDILDLNSISLRRFPAT
jgi:hypothetical protein